MLDFTQKTYKSILEHLAEAGYKFPTFEEFNSNPQEGKIAILRHDVDRAPRNAVKMASLENSMGIKSSYYFRVVKESYDENCIKEIISLGHEMGYHYEDLTLADGDRAKAIIQFKINLDNFRRFYPVKTMCMHGSPMSKFDNRLLWDTYGYKEYDIIAEPYFDMDFNQVFYITDASRAWNNEAVTVRDKVKSNFRISIATSKDIIELIKSKKLPEKIMLSTHPHNWADGIAEWMKIKAWQGLKNQFKRIIVNKS